MNEYTTADYLNQLEQDRQDLVDNLETQGISGLSGDETFTELVPEVLNISTEEAPKSLKDINTMWQNAWNSYISYLNESNDITKRIAYTNESVTLHSPAEGFKFYYICVDSQGLYTIYWKQADNMYVDLPRYRLPGWYYNTTFDQMNVYRNSDNEWYINNYYEKQFNHENGYQREVYLKSNIPTLEEAIDCLKSSSTEYYHDTRWTISVYDITNFGFITNDTLLIPENDEYVVCDLPCISHNEIIVYNN